MEKYLRVVSLPCNTLICLDRGTFPQQKLPLQRYLSTDYRRIY